MLNDLIKLNNFWMLDVSRTASYEITLTQFEPKLVLKLVFLLFSEV